MVKQQNPTAVVLWKDRPEQILKVQMDGDKSAKTLVVQGFPSSLDGIIRHDVTILTDLQRGKYALVPCDRGLPRIQMVDVLQRGLQMLHPEVGEARRFFWGFEPVRTPLFGHTWYAVQALTKQFIDRVQDGLAKSQVNIQHLGLLIVELARAAIQQWGPKTNAVLLHEYRFGQLDMGLVIQGELLYTRYLGDISHLPAALREAEERFDLYHPKMKMPASLPIYLTGQGPLCRDIVLRPDLQRIVQEAYTLHWWPWPGNWAIENASDLPHREEEGESSEFGGRVEEHWSLLLTQLAPPPERAAAGALALWKWLAVAVFLIGTAAIAGSVYLAYMAQPNPPLPSPSPPPGAGQQALPAKARALEGEIARLEQEVKQLRDSLRPAHPLIRALRGPLPGGYRLEGIVAMPGRENRVHLDLTGPPVPKAELQLIAHLKKLKHPQGAPLLRGVGRDPAGAGLFRGTRPGPARQHIFLSGEVSG